MTSLRHRVIAAVSALMILVAIVVLPGCKKSTDAPTKAPAKKAPDVGME